MNEKVLPEAESENKDISQRPIVITIIAVALFLNGVITIVTGFMFDAGLLVLALGAAALILSVGLWQLWPWAWVGTILLQLIALGEAFYDWYALGSINFWAMGIGIIIILYLLRAEIRGVFFS